MRSLLAVLCLCEVLQHGKHCPSHSTISMVSIHEWDCTMDADRLPLYMRDSLST